MTSESLKKAVVASYGKLAQSTQKALVAKLFPCCDPSDQLAHTDQVGTLIGYSQEELNAVPEGANLGVGCGNPAALATIAAGETVVDLGSGAGFDAFIVSKIVGDKGKVIGVDLSEDMLALARQHAAKGSITNVEFIKGDIEALPLPTGIADHVISNCVINLAPDKGAVFQEAFRVLKPGGKLAISDVILERELPAEIRQSLAGHIACISGAEKLTDYLQHIADAGFTNISIESKTQFPLEVMMADPQIQEAAQAMNMSLDSLEAQHIASSVKSISVSAKK